MKTILVVTDRFSTKRRFIDLLMSSGFGVIHCAGPEPPGSSCRQDNRYGICSDALLADAVLLDADLASDAMQEAPSSEAVMERYRNLDLPLVVLVGPEDVPAWIGDDEAVVLSRKTPEPDVIAALRGVMMCRDERRRAANGGGVPSMVAS